MRARQWRGRIWAARLGLLALALHSLVPVHVAFDLAEALQPARQHSGHAEASGAERHLLALLIGHTAADDESGEHGKHHGAACPVCSALGALAGFVPPAPTALSAPAVAALPAALSVIQAEPIGAPAAYRSRAPPVA
jgi:Protein of unknown function (DUF2946)